MGFITNLFLLSSSLTPPFVISTIGRDLIAIPGIGMKRKSFAHELHEFARKRNWQLVFSGFADKNNCPFFD